MLLLNSFCAAFQRAIHVFILACACCTAVAAQPLRIADDLQATSKLARGQRAPILLVFTLTHCPYCATARRDYLVPMQASEQWRDKVLMREIVIDSGAALRDFNGETLSVRAFAKRHGISRVPTVIVFDGNGAPVTQPLIGLSSSDFYGLYLEQAVEAGLVKMRISAP